VKYIKGCQYLISSLFIAQIIACGGGGSSSGNGEANLYSIPDAIGGESISFTLKTADGASVPEGLTIKYSFEPNGNVVGVNPVTQQPYNPGSYSYTSNPSSSVVTLDYSNLSAGAYEKYTLIPNSCNSGTYSSDSFIQGLSASATGTYVIEGYTCSGSGSVEFWGQYTNFHIFLNGP